MNANDPAGRGTDPAAAPDLSATLDAAIAAVRAGETARAERLCADVHAQDPGNATASYVLAHAGLARGDEAAAASHFQAALAHEPGFAHAHNDLGNLRWQQDRPADAAACYRAALAADPAFAEGHNNLGVALKDLGDLDGALASFDRALALRRDYAEAHYNRCGLLEKTNRLDALREAVASAREACPDSAYVALRAAQLAKREGDHAGARALLASVEPPPGDLGFEGEQEALLADLCDRLGEADAAFAHAEESNRCQRLTPAAKRCDPGAYRAHVARLSKRFTAEWVATWAEVPDEPARRRAPVFLVGFPRTGTTLLDSILRSHPDVAVVEEQGGVAAMLRRLAALPGGHPDALARLTGEDAAALRAAYWDEMARHLPPDGQPAVVVDKLPLNLVEAGAIHRVFPDARFLFAQRHPYDCVLSAFMHAFRLNDAMANFLRLRDAARLYDAVMRVWNQYTAVLPLDVQTVTYEHLTADFERTVGSLLDGLGLSWTDAVRAHDETARRRAKINTPSYGEVTQPIHTRAQGRWRRYREHLAPVLDTLRPWAEHLGYETEDRA